jgi:molybdopterin-guanine dinucleotide biosynthesis protein A
MGDISEHAVSLANAFEDPNWDPEDYVADGGVTGRMVWEKQAIRTLSKVPEAISQARAEGREAGLREAAELRDVVADEIDAGPMSSIHSALCEYRNAILALIDTPPTEGGE